MYPADLLQGSSLLTTSLASREQSRFYVRNVLLRRWYAANRNVYW
jgi:hypothetical protein